jgi:glucose-6-phosphate 1-dehydrogenase
MAKRGNLDIPIVGVAKSGWSDDQLRARARESVEKHGGLDREAFDRMCRLLRYVGGDYHDASTFQRIRKALASAAGPAHYLAIPPVLFGLVTEQLECAACSDGARVIVEKPFGTDLASARELNRILLRTFQSLESFASTTTSGNSPSVTCCTSGLPTSFSIPSGIVQPWRAFRSQWPKISVCKAEAPFTIAPGRSAM